MKQLAEMNKFDLQLFEYAKSLVALRLMEFKKIVETAAMDTPDNQGKSMHCKAVPGNFLVVHKPYFGVFQPPGHKGP
jgi:hypothetical protein